MQMANEAGEVLLVSGLVNKLQQLKTHGKCTENKTNKKMQSENVES